MRDQRLGNLGRIFQMPSLLGPVTVKFFFSLSPPCFVSGLILDFIFFAEFTWNKNTGGGRVTRLVIQWHNAMHLHLNGSIKRSR